jgi:hypothetical protein
MDPEIPARKSRSRPWVLIVLVVAAVALVLNMMWPDSSTTTQVTPSNEVASTGARPKSQPLDPAELNVRLEALQADRPAPGEAERNPFRFEAKPAPPPPPTPPPTEKPAGEAESTVPSVPTGPPPPPPIPLKFMGFVEKRGVKYVALSDCKAATFAVLEGQTVDGRYRLVKIGHESIVMEYVNGTGRETIRLTGECPPR